MTTPTLREANSEAQSLVEQLAINRYRPVPAGVIAYKVIAGDGTRTLFSGTKDECQIVARKLTEAFLDGAHAALAALAAQPQLPEPLCAFRRKSQIDQEWETCSKKQWAIFSQKPAHYELALFYTAAQLQQAVEQATITRYTTSETLRLKREFAELLCDYWDAAYRQGVAESDTDTPDGAAQSALSKLNALFESLVQARAKREPMTEVEINRMCGGMAVSVKWNYLLNFARAIEAHHGIGDKA